VNDKAQEEPGNLHDEQALEVREPVYRITCSCRTVYPVDGSKELLKHVGLTLNLDEK
jgi:hypothetical protein